MEGSALDSLTFIYRAITNPDPRYHVTREPLKLRVTPSFTHHTRPKRLHCRVPLSLSCSSSPLFVLQEVLGRAIPA
jgi:hypothetical protein